MITKVITIGSNSNCDFVISEIAMPTIDASYFEGISPVHAQIVQENNQYYLLPFSDRIFINNKCVAELPSFRGNNSDKTIRLDFDDKITIGIFDIFWQQWMASLGLRCDKCRYHQLRLSNDEWCNYCEQSHHNPSPYEYGYSSIFSENKNFFNYTNCKQCSLKPDWCIECNFFLEPEPKNRSYKEHVDLYLQRINGKTCEAVRAGNKI